MYIFAANTNKRMSETTKEAGCFHRDPCKDAGGGGVCSYMHNNPFFCISWMSFKNNIFAFFFIGHKCVNMF